MTIGDYVLHEDEEYTIEAKTVGGDKVKISRTVFNFGWFRNRQKTKSLWVCRSKVTQIMTIIGDEEPAGQEEGLVHKLRAELANLIQTIELKKSKSTQHHFLERYDNMLLGDWNQYHSGLKGWRLYNSSDNDDDDIWAETLEGLIKKVNAL